MKTHTYFNSYFYGYGIIVYMHLNVRVLINFDIVR
jgi:hypothetical protein